MPSMEMLIPYGDVDVYENVDVLGNVDLVLC